MAKHVDTVGLSCPMPILLTQEAIKSGEAELEIVVDTRGRAEDATELLERAGYAVSEASDEDDNIVLSARK